MHFVAFGSKLSSCCFRMWTMHVHAPTLLVELQTVEHLDKGLWLDIFIPTFLMASDLLRKLLSIPHLSSCCSKLQHAVHPSSFVAHLYQYYSLVHLNFYFSLSASATDALRIYQLNPNMFHKYVYIFHSGAISLSWSTLDCMQRPRPPTLRPSWLPLRLQPLP